MDPATRFSDDEIERILARAADRQEQAERALPAIGAPRADASGGPQARGLTLAQLEEVAREAGIDPAHVQAAAREVQLRVDRPVARRPFLGIPKELVERRQISDAIDDREWESIVGELRTLFRVHGVVTTFGDVREWTSSAGPQGGSPGVLRIEPTDQGTDVSLRLNTSAMSILTHTFGWTFGGMAALFGVLSAVGQMGSGGPAAAVALGLVSAGTFLGGRWASRLWVRRTNRKFRELLDRIEHIAHDVPPLSRPGT